MPRQLPTPDAYTFLIAAVIGLAFGAFLSFIFGRYTLPTRIPSEFTILGLPTGVILANVVIFAIVGAVVFLAYASYIVQDTTFPSAHPALFILETLIVGFVPASVIYVITGFRHEGRIDLPAINMDFVLLGSKFALFHLLFQFSGIYSYLLQK